MSATLKLAMEVVRPNGWISKVGWGHRPLNFSLDPLVQKNVTLQGSDTLEISMMFDLYADDFLEYEKSQGDTNPSLVAYLNRFLPEEKHLPDASSLRIKYVPYNWVPNDQSIP